MASALMMVSRRKNVFATLQAITYSLSDKIN